MQPQELVNCLSKLQMASNKLTLASMYVSKSIGDYLMSISSTGDPELCNPSEQAAFMGNSLNCCNAALTDFCDASTTLYKLITGGNNNG